jgi:hypothetical protein
MDTPVYADSPEGRFLDECIRVIKAINARTSALIHEFEHVRQAIERENRTPTAAPEAKQKED